MAKVFLNLFCKISWRVFYQGVPKTLPICWQTIAYVCILLKTLVFQAVTACRTPTKVKTKLPVHSWNPIFLFTKPYIQAILVGKTLSRHNSQIFRAFNLIPRLRARPKYQLSSGTYFLIYLVWLRFLSFSATFCYVQPWWATLNYS